MKTLILYLGIAALYLLIGIIAHSWTKKIIKLRKPSAIYDNTWEDNMWLGFCLFLWPIIPVGIAVSETIKLVRGKA